jgi:hypothetical protein
MMWVIVLLLGAILGTLSAIYFQLSEINTLLRTISVQQRAQGGDLAALRIRSGAP